MTLVLTLRHVFRSCIILPSKVMIPPRDLKFPSPPRSLSPSPPPPSPPRSLSKGDAPAPETSPLSEPGLHNNSFGAGGACNTSSGVGSGPLLLIGPAAETAATGAVLAAVEVSVQAPQKVDAPSERPVAASERGASQTATMASMPTVPSMPLPPLRQRSVAELVILEILTGVLAFLLMLAFVALIVAIGRSAKWITARREAIRVLRVESTRRTQAALVACCTSGSSPSGALCPWPNLPWPQLTASQTAAGDAVPTAATAAPQMAADANAVQPAKALPNTAVNAVLPGSTAAPLTAAVSQTAADAARPTASRGRSSTTAAVPPTAATQAVFAGGRGPLSATTDGTGGQDTVLVPPLLRRHRRLLSATTDVQSA